MSSRRSRARRPGALPARALLSSRRGFAAALPSLAAERPRVTEDVRFPARAGGALFCDLGDSAREPLQRLDLDETERSLGDGATLEPDPACVLVPESEAAGFPVPGAP